MRSLAARALEDEQMDAAELDPATYAAILTDLAKVNRLTMTARPTLGFLERALGRATTFRLLDVGFGDGDMLRAIARWADARDIRADLTGIDLNPKSAAVATLRAGRWCRACSHRSSSSSSSPAWRSSCASC